MPALPAWRSSRFERSRARLFVTCLIPLPAGCATGRLVRHREARGRSEPAAGSGQANRDRIRGLEDGRSACRGRTDEKSTKRGDRGTGRLSAERGPGCDAGHGRQGDDSSRYRLADGTGRWFLASSCTGRFEARPSGACVQSRARGGRELRSTRWNRMPVREPGGHEQHPLCGDEPQRQPATDRTVSRTAWMDHRVLPPLWPAL
jgi:hypothetical protein